MSENDYRERKRIRTEWYMKYIYKNKMITCSACSGSGYYDGGYNHPKCGSCQGKGKVFERSIIPLCLYRG